MSVLPHQNLYGAPQKTKDSVKMLYDKTINQKKLTASEDKSLVKSKSDSNVKVYTSKKRKKLN